MAGLMGSDDVWGEPAAGYQGADKLHTVDESVEFEE